MGLPLMSVDTGLELFDAALRTSRPAFVAATLDTATLERLTLEHFAPAEPDRRSSWARRLAGRSDADQVAILLDLVRGKIAEVLWHNAPTAIDADRGLLDLGFDSLTAVDLRNRLGAVTGLRLPTTFAFDHPTPTALAHALHAKIIPPQPLSVLDELEEQLLAVDRTMRPALVRRLRDVLTRLDPNTDDLLDLIDIELGKG
jgi:pimaricinolide synthase PimS1